MTIHDYLREYLEKFDTTPPAADPVAQLEACQDRIWAAYRRAKLPLLSAEQRQLMVGHLTSDQIELLLRVVEFLTNRPDLAAAWGLPASAFQEIIDKDAELLRLRACATLVIEASDRTLRQAQATIH